MKLTDTSEHKAHIAAKPEGLGNTLVVVTVAVCFVATLIPALSRSGGTPADTYSIFQRLFFFNDYVGSWAMLIALITALAWPRGQEALVRLASWVGEHPVRTIAAAFVVLALCSRYVYLSHPLSMDEYAPWMQAHAFAQGELKAYYPPQLLDAIVPPQFQGMFIVVDHATGDTVSKYWPGLALVMAPFARFDLVWCVNPAFGALSLFVLYKLASDAAGDRSAGGWAILAALASPQFTVGSISFYAMPGELALNLLFVWLLLRPSLACAFAAGMVGGLALAMHQPVPHALVALPCLVWLAWSRARWTRLVAVCTGYLPLVLMLGFGWTVLLGSIGQGSAAAPVASSSGAVATGVAAQAAGIMKSLLTLPNAEMLTNRWFAAWKVWIWALPGLLPMLFIPRVRGTAERLLLAGLALTFVFHFFIRFDQGHGWGYRYIHPAWGALPLAAGLWLASTTDAMRRHGAAMVAAGLVATPIFMWQTHATIRHELSFRLAPLAASESVVFVGQNTGMYRGDLVQNTPGEVTSLRLLSRGEEDDRALMERFFPGSVRVEQEHRGSVWRVPDGALAAIVRRPGQHK